MWTASVCRRPAGMGEGRGGGARHLIKSTVAHLRPSDVCLRREKMAWVGMNGGLWERVCVRIWSVPQMGPVDVCGVSFMSTHEATHTGGDLSGAPVPWGSVRSSNIFLRCCLHKSKSLAFHMGDRGPSPVRPTHRNLKEQLSPEPLTVMWEPIRWINDFHFHDLDVISSPGDSRRSALTSPR